MSALANIRTALDEQPFPKVVVKSRDLRQLLETTARLRDALESARANVATLFSVVGQPRESVQDILDRYDAAIALVKDVSGNGQISSPSDLRGFTEWEHEPDEFDRSAEDDARTLRDLRDEMRSKARGKSE